jgi:hypothetical protein
VTKSANELMHELLVAAVVDGIVALKAASKGLPNNLLRDLGAIHANTAPADLPEQLQASIRASVREAFTRLLRHGYSVATAHPAPRTETRPPPVHGHRRPGPGPRGAPDRPPRPGPGPRGDRPKRPGPGGGAGKPRGKPGPRGR